MMRDTLAQDLKDAVKARDTRKVSTLRMIQAAIKDRDIAQRPSGKGPVTDDEISAILARMIKQREESAGIYDKAGRDELAAQEREEIGIIQAFLPAQLDEAELEAACRAVIAETGAVSLRDMGRCMSLLKERYPGRMDFSQASATIKRLLG